MAIPVSSRPSFSLAAIQIDPLQRHTCTGISTLLVRRPSTSNRPEGTSLVRLDFQNGNLAAISTYVVPMLTTSRGQRNAAAERCGKRSVRWKQMGS